MLIQRFAEQCIICLDQSPFAEGNSWSTEHIIPKALGGILACAFVCKTCNSKMGNGFERLAKADPSIRIAIRHLSAELPDLHASIEEGQDHTVKTAVGTIKGKYRKGEIQGGTRRLDDGSLLVAPQIAEKQIRNILAGEGLDEIAIQEALEIHKHAEAGNKVDLSSKTSIILRAAEYGGPNLANGEILNPLVALKIAYEYAVLIAGLPILEPLPALQAVRRCLVEQTVSQEDFSCESLSANDYMPFHGIAFEGNDPSASFQIRLFGKLAYRIKFLKFAINTNPIIYTHNLKTGGEQIEESKPSHAAII